MKITSIAALLAAAHTKRCGFAHEFLAIVDDKIFGSDEQETIEHSPFYEAFDSESNGVPTAVFHGLGDACMYPGMGSLDSHISKKTGKYVKCIEVGLPTFGEYFNNFEHVAEVSCKKVAADKNFQGEFNVMGLS